MKLVKSASGKTVVKMTRSEWTDMGKKAGWLGKKAGVGHFAEIFADAYDDFFGHYYSL